MPWQSIGAFLRITTHPRIYERPLTATTAWEHCREWLDQPSVSLLDARPSTVRAYREVTDDVDVTGNLVTDALLAALALDYATPLASADNDFARFTAIEWINPLDM